MQICGLKWSWCGSQLASGGNDNNLCIFDAQFQLQHKVQAHSAAVKALAWCPYQANLLASGGGTADRCIRFWNTHTGAQLSCIDTGSQVRLQGVAALCIMYMVMSMVASIHRCQGPAPMGLAACEGGG